MCCVRSDMYVQKQIIFCALPNSSPDTIIHPQQSNFTHTSFLTRHSNPKSKFSILLHFALLGEVLANAVGTHTTLLIKRLYSNLCTVMNYITLVRYPHLLSVKGSRVILTRIGGTFSILPEKRSLHV